MGRHKNAKSEVISLSLNKDKKISHGTPEQDKIMIDKFLKQQRKK